MIKSFEFIYYSNSNISTPPQTRENQFLREGTHVTCDMVIRILNIRLSITKRHKNPSKIFFTKIKGAPACENK